MPAAVPRRTCLTLLLAAPLAGRAQPIGTADLLLQAVAMRTGLERMVKLELEHRVLKQERALLQLHKERERTARALDALSQPIKALSGRREAQVQRALQEASELMGQLSQPAPALLGASEALGVRLGFVTTTLSGLGPDPDRAVLVDLLARSSATALRLAKFNFAVAGLSSAGGSTADMAVSAQQSLGEFRAALASVASQRLDERGRADLQLAQNQWLLLSHALGSTGLAKSPERLAEVATTTDRIAESMLALARRV